MLRPPEHLSRSPYFVNGWLDTAVIGGLSIIVFLGLRLFSTGEVTPAAVEAAAVLSVFVNYPHFSATVYRLYQSPENIRQFPVTSLGLPLLLVGAVALSLWQPQWVAPYFVTLFFIWSPYHYSGQTIGVTMLYARRSGFEIGRWQRLALSAFVFSTFLANFAHARNTEPMARYGVMMPVIHFPAWFETVMIGVMCVGAIVFLGFVLAWVVLAPAHAAADRPASRLRAIHLVSAGKTVGDVLGVRPAVS